MSSLSVSFSAADGTTLRGTLFRPDGDGPFPVVTLQSGLGGPASSIHAFAAPFVDRGLACLIYDHRNTGASDGEPRQEFDPWRQCRDLRDVLTWLSLRDDIDASRMALWGISIGGANSLFTAALDKRVRALAVLIPPVSGLSAKKLQPADVVADLENQIPQDRQGRYRGEKARTLRLHGEPIDGDPVMFSDAEGLEFVENMIKDAEGFVNAITLSTLDYLYEMEVAAYAERIDQPLMMVLATQDTVAPVEEAREMFDRVPEPKVLIEYPGQHYEILSNHLPELLDRTAEYLLEQLNA